MVVDFQVPASEYWKMSPQEVGRYLERKRPKYIGDMHENDYYKLIEHRENKIKDGVNIL